MRAPAVFLVLLLLAGCKDHAPADFDQAWNDYMPTHVSGSDK